MSAAPHIFTLTGNLLAERTFDFLAWSPGRTQRATREAFQVGGKGINVSKMLSRLGAANTALCFTGGAAGQECAAWMQERGFSLAAFETDRGTRVGTVVRSENQPETTFLGPDVAPSATAMAACAAYLDAQGEGQVLAFCGSFPGWDRAECDPLRAALQRWLQRGILAVDTYGPPLDWLARLPVALIKINATEFRALRADEASTDAALDEVARQRSAVRWVVTDGSGPVRFRDGSEGVPETIMPPVVREISATGSGDVLFACLLDSLYVKHTSLREALARGLPLAAANAAHAGVADFPEPANVQR